MLLPAPCIFAPILFRKLARSTISGSIAAFTILVSPSARVASSIIFSVAPTLGKSRWISVPIILSAVQLIKPASSFISTPSSLNAFRCRSIGLAPISHPPWI